jgi:hypothetical protein
MATGVGLVGQKMRDEAERVMGGDESHFSDIDV